MPGLTAPDSRREPIPTPAIGQVWTGRNGRRFTVAAVEDHGPHGLLAVGTDGSRVTLAGPFWTFRTGGPQPDNDPPAAPDRGLLSEMGRVVRQFQRYTPEQRADRAGSHRLGHRQRTAVGEHFYTHPDLPGRAFDSRKEAAEAAVRAAGPEPEPDDGCE